MNKTMQSKQPSVAPRSAVALAPSGPSPVSRTLQVAGAVLLVFLVLGGTVALAAWSERIPGPGHLLRDPTSVAHAPWWFGVVSRVVSLCWAASTTVIVLAAVAARAELRRPLLLLGALSAMLTLDDTLLLHDAVLPGRGMTEGLVLIAYVVAGLLLALWWWPHHHTDVGMAFFVGAGCLAASVGCDAVFGNAYVAEEAAKLLGIVAWGFCGTWAFTAALARGEGVLGHEDRAASQ